MIQPPWRSSGLKVWLSITVLTLLPECLGAQNVGFAVDNSLGAVRVLDLTQRRVSGTIAVGQHPAEMLILPNNQMALVTSQDNNNVAVVDLQSQTLTATIPAGQSPGSLIGSSDGRFVYVANEGSNDITVLDAVARSALATIPVDATPSMVNLSPNGRYLYVVNQDSDPTGTISVIDTNRRQVVGTLEVGLRPVQFAISPELTTAYVVNNGSNSVSIVDLGTNQVTGEISVGQGPTSVAFSSDGRSMYVVNRNSNSITAADISQNKILGQIPVGSQPADMVLTFDGRYGFVSNQGSNSVTLLDLVTRTAELTIATGLQPFDLALDPNEDFLYVTNLASQSVTVIDVNTDRAVATIPIGGVPVQFTQYNAPTLLELAPNPASAGSNLILNGEGILPSSTVQFVTTTPPRNVKVVPQWLDSQGLQVIVPSLPGASNPVVSVLHPDGNSSEQLTVRFGSVSSFITAGGVIEGAGLQPSPYPISGGSIVSVVGSFPGVLESLAASFPLPTSLGGAQVTFNGAPAPLLLSSTSQIYVITPLHLFARSSVRVAVSSGNQTSRVEAVNVEPAAPGIFRIAATGLGAFTHASRPTRLVTTSDPARRGETLILYASGLGATFPEGLEGEPAPSDVVSPTLAAVAVTVGEMNAAVLLSGLVPDSSGIYQIILEVPAESPVGNDIPVVVTAGARSSNTARLAVR